MNEFKENNQNLLMLINEWMNALNTPVTLKIMIIDYLRHFELHLNEIDELINKI